ncbi:MAG: OmpA family protein [Candidatus Hydrogenedentota bacterium]
MRQVASILMAMCAGWAVWAAEIPEHPLIRPFPGSVLAENMSKHSDFEAYEFRVANPDTGKAEKRLVKGEYWRLLYGVRNADGSRVTDISRVEFQENFRAAAEEKGGEVLWEDPKGVLTFTVPRDDGGITYCELEAVATLGQQYLTIVDEKPLATSLKFGPAEMKAALDKDGRVLLYGILFDYDKASLQKESLEQLEHVVTLLQDNPDLALEVQGHTDDQGSDDYNLELSQRRARTVRSFLLLFGIDEGRLTAKGYGETRPVAPNDGDENRAKNRRVELVKQDAAQAASQDTAPASLDQLIVGTWAIAPNDRATEGTVIFEKNGRYDMTERFKDGSGGGTKGDYRLDCESTPARIALYLGKFGNDPADLTTRFGIVRALSADELEIQFSPEGKYPDHFEENPSGMYTLMLTRTK